jgi:catalase
MFTRVNADLGKRIQTATEAAVAGAATPKMAVATDFANMKLADLHAKKQTLNDNAHNFDLFAHKAWNLS